MTSNHLPMIGHDKNTKHGPGGRDCPCCAEPPGKPRKAERRYAKRQDRAAWRKEVRAYA